MDEQQAAKTTEHAKHSHRTRFAPKSSPFGQFHSVTHSHIHGANPHWHEQVERNAE